MIIQTFSGQLLICCWGSPSQTRSTWTHLWGRAPCPCRGWGTARHRAPGPAWASPSRMSVVKDLCENYETSVLNSRCGKRKYWMLFRDWLILDVIFKIKIHKNQNFIWMIQKFDDYCLNISIFNNSKWWFNKNRNNIRSFQASDLFNAGRRYMYGFWLKRIEFCIKKSMQRWLLCIKHNYPFWKIELRCLKIFMSKI